MNLKKRFAVSNAAIIVIPLVVTFVASFLFIFILNKVLNVDTNYESFKKLAEIQYQFFRADEDILSNNPQMLLEKDYQQYLVSYLEGIEADIIVIKGQKKVFASRSIGLVDIERILDSSNRSRLSNKIDIDGNRHIMKVIEVNFKDGEKGQVILLAYTGNEWFSPEKLLLIIGTIFVISFLLTNIFLIIGFSKRILKPLSKLQDAAGKISGGELNFEVIEDGDEEIRDLCKAFEVMRLKLLESKHTQKKYDDTRKMLLSSISHDIKTPITSIKGYVEGILDGVANTPEKSEKYLKTVYSKANHIDRMIDDLLLYSKLDLNQVPFDIEITDVKKYFEDCMYEIETELERDNIKTKLHNELKNSKYFMIDRVRVRRVIINIIENSRKYIPKNQGKIDIFLRETNTSIVIEIRDNGSGIDEKDLPNIFDRFYRADSSRNVTKGSGLGLAIAKQIIEGHGGDIWARSEKGEGTSILISIKKYS
ncbi:UNVERIFIED_CONTAM: HAMP domain-containing protein [Acetivibrio alkalicellulosi]